MAIFVCTCGFIGNGIHAKTCQEYKKELLRVEKNAAVYVLDRYLKTYSVTDCCEHIQATEKTNLTLGKIRPMVNRILDSNNIREGLAGNNLNKQRQHRTRATMLKKYGVINAGQLAGNGFKKLNKIPYAKLAIATDLENFKKKVERLTFKYLNILKKEGTLPSACYYTNIEFADNRQKLVNPNDPFKRTADHRLPVVEGFLLGLTPEQVSSPDNIVWCLRTVNTLKNNTDEERFTKVILPHLIKRLNNENTIN